MPKNTIELWGTGWKKIIMKTIQNTKCRVQKRYSLTEHYRKLLGWRRHNFPKYWIVYCYNILNFFFRSTFTVFWNFLTNEIFSSKKEPISINIRVGERPMLTDMQNFHLRGCFFWMCEYKPWLVLYFISQMLQCTFLDPRPLWLASNWWRIRSLKQDTHHTFFISFVSEKIFHHLKCQLLISNFGKVSAKIQCCGSMTFWCGSGSGSTPLTNGSGFGSFFSLHRPSRCQQKTN